MNKNQVNSILAHAISEVDSISITEDYLNNYTLEQAVLEHIDSIGNEDDTLSNLSLKKLPTKLARINHLLDSLVEAKKSALELIDKEE